MIKLLAKQFIKNYSDTEDMNVRNAYGVLCGGVGIALNVLLFLMKFIAGTLSASIAITADAFNNLSDALSSVVTLIGFKMALKPADREHPYGHGRMEYISALAVSFIILLMGVELLKTSAVKILSPTEVEFNLFSIVALFIAIGVKLYMFMYNRAVGRTLGAPAMIATARDSASDVLATSAVLIGVVLYAAFGINMDGALGTVVAFFILYTGVKSMKEMLTQLLGTPPSSELVGEIERFVMSHEGVVGVHDLIVHDYGPGRMMMSIHAEVSAESDVFEMHDLIDNIEQALREKFNCEAVIHMDPVVTDDALLNSVRADVTAALQKIGEGFTIHDFRMVTGPTHTNLIFDTVVPYECKESDSALRIAISDAIHSIAPEYNAVTKIDRNYCG